MFEVNNKDTDVVLVSLLLTLYIITPFSSFSIVILVFINIQQVLVNLQA